MHCRDKQQAHVLILLESACKGRRAHFHAEHDIGRVKKLTIETLTLYSQPSVWRDSQGVLCCRAAFHTWVLVIAGLRYTHMLRYMNTNKMFRLLGILRLCLCLTVVTAEQPGQVAAAAAAAATGDYCQSKQHARLHR
jgi:hypothetical protein